MIVMLAGLGYLYLVLCFYVVHRTGSTEGLADIGDAALLSVAADGAGRRRWTAQVARVVMCALEAGSARDPPTPAGL